jgi:APA family basic amino acid/polyamine antiporter
MVFGYAGGVAMTGLVMFSAFGALAGIVLSGPRVYYAMARDGMLFKWVAELHPRYHTPHRAIVLQALWASVLVGTGTYRALFTRVVYTEWIFFGLMAIGLFMLRRRPGVTRAYSAWGYPWAPALFAIAAFAIVVNQVINDPVESALGLGMVAVGYPVYRFWAKPDRILPETVA